MRARQLQALLTVLSGLLLLGQLGLYGWMSTVPPPPERLPTLAPVERELQFTKADTTGTSDALALVALERILDARITAAARRQGQDPAPLLAPPELRAAAAADPAPDGPAVQALIAHGGAALQALGETLDATSSPGTAAAP